MKGCKKKEKRKRKKRNDNTRKRERERVSSREKFPHELLPPPARNDQLFLPSMRCTTPRGAKKGRSSPCLSSFEKENRNYDSVVTTRLRHWEESVTRWGEEEEEEEEKDLGGLPRTSLVSRRRDD